MKLFLQKKMQNFRALGAPSPDPRASGGWGLFLKLQKIDCTTRAFNKFTVLRRETFVFSQETDIAIFVIQLYSIFSKTQ